MTFDLAAAIANHHEYFHAKQTVVVRNDVVGSSDSVAGVTSSKLSFRAMQQIGFLGVQDEARSFSLPAVNCSAAPAIGHRIVDAAGVDWRILSVEKTVMDTCYACACVTISDDDAKPLQPYGLTITTPASLQTTTLNVAWTHRKPGTLYAWTLERSTSAAFTSPTTTTGTSSAVNPSTTATGLTANTHDYFRVKHTDETGEDSPWSDAADKTTAAA